jgi:hypothetical protein
LTDKFALPGGFPTADFGDAGAPKISFGQLPGEVEEKLQYWELLPGRAAVFFPKKRNFSPPAGQYG